MLFIFLLCIEIFSFVLLKLFPEIRISIIYFVENSIIHHKVVDFDEKMKYLLQVCFLIMEMACVTAMLHIVLHNLYDFLSTFKNIYLLQAELLICDAVILGIFAIEFSKIFNRAVADSGESERSIKEDLL